uniref:NR LBD domain-containing protein n=1 Tax=Meloidogyne hapla TaxID=6305 RepID=A0A1I8AXS4_MELHA
MVNFTFPENYSAVPTSRSLDFASPLVVVHSLKSTDPLIRLYGLKQLQRTCCGTPIQRIPLYSLSQPGEHPRNWLSLREVSVQLIQDVIYHLQQQTKFHCAGVGGRKAAIAEFIEKDGSFSTTPTENVSPTIVLNELYEGRRSLFMPPALKPRLAEQFQAELQPRKVIRLPSFVEAFLVKASRLFFFLFHSPILGAYETLCTLLAIKALSRTIIHSIEEDRFGVVQKDLKLCISKLTRLSIAIDAYVRARGRSATPSNINQFNVHLLDVELASALKDIRTVFAPYIDDLNLHPTEAEVFRMLI